MKFTYISALASLLVISTSCSWYRDLQRSLVDDDEKQMKGSMRPVPREQYDQLLVKYEELSKKYENLKENPTNGKSSLVDELQNSQTENFAQTSPNAETETVSVFPDPNVAAAAAVAGAAGRGGPQVSADVEEQLNLYRRGLALKASNPGEATKIFQQLENQGVPSVKARAKLQVGELLFSRQQYDLALQVFEDIINKNSYSGVVLDALKYAVVCSDKLSIPAKKDQYSSMLKDVFEAN